MVISRNNTTRDITKGFNGITGDANPGDTEIVADEAAEPKVGICFSGGEELAAFVYSYAFKTGFEWFIRSNILLEEFREKGVKQNRAGEKEPRFHMLKRLRLQCKKGGRASMMKITQCNLIHNHPTDPCNSRLMDRMMLNDAAGISIANNYNSLVLEGGGHENLPFNRVDLRNAINKEHRRDYFDQMKSLSPDFFFRIERDDEGKLLNVFWADARCRAMCKDFGDVISYDTTFLCNRSTTYTPISYCLFLGRCTPVVCILSLRYQTVFVTPRPNVDRERLLTVARQTCIHGPQINTGPFQLFFGLTHAHPENFQGGHPSQDCSPASTLNWRSFELIHGPLQLTWVVKDFDGVWKDMVEKYSLHNNPWVKESYEIRSRWVPAYWRSTFCARMSSTQRSEQQNRFFKTFVNSRTGLRQFIEQFDGALRSKVEEEKQNNFACVDRPLRCDKSILVEDVFYKLYTNEKFKEVKDEVLGLLHTNVVLVLKMGSYTKYATTEKIVNPIWRTTRKTFDVDIDTAKGEFNCTCKLFEFKGILCRHIIRCIEIEDVKFIPDKYIVNRWRKDLVRPYDGKWSALQDDESYGIYVRGTVDVIKELEVYSGIENINSYASCGGSSRVWGRRRLQRRESRITPRNTTTGEGRLKDPFDKRGSGRAPRPRQKTFRKKNAWKHGIYMAPEWIIISPY
ncbi:hypothetical protein RND81_04G159500 [Saponaria officinalis]|uniref:SWIM-type domain-containing protein n=1 Tax=Saponaria officinalis TaxID=3572 RepID=A0AAW1LMJ6_SAPOF